MGKLVLLKKNQLLERGWTEEKVDYFLIKNHGAKQTWDFELVKRYEDKEKFINFAQIDGLLSAKEKFKEIQMEMTQEAIQRIGVRVPFFRNEKSLLNLGIDYMKKDSSLDEIIHFPSGSNFSTDGMFYAYSDGCRKAIGGKEPVTCAGWIEDSTGRIVVEFTKEIKKEEDQESFEKAGIEKLIDIAISVNIKHIKMHTDSRGDAENIGFSQINIYEKKHKYLEIIDKIENFEDFSICHIPRDFNQHADALTKILLLPYEQEKIRDIEKSRSEIVWENPVVDREKEIYFEHSNLKSLDTQELFNSALWCIYSLSYTTKTHSANLHNFLINTKTKEFHLVSQISRDSVYQSLIESLPLEQVQGKIKGTDSEQIHNMTVLLNQFTYLKNIAIHIPNGGFQAIVDKLKPIPGNMQEEFFLAHTAISKYENVSMGLIPDDLLKKIKCYVGEENYKVYNLNSPKKLKS